MGFPLSFFGVRTRQAVAHVMVPTNLLATLIAFETWAGEGGPAELTVLLHQHYADDETAERIGAVMRSMLRPPVSCRALVVVPQSQFLAFGTDAPQRLREVLGLARADAVIYSHDLSGDSVQRLSHAYSGAELICTGDGFGAVLQKNRHFAFVGAPLPPEMDVTRASTLDRIRSRLAGYPVRERRRSEGSIMADRFMMALPIDQFGGVMDQAPLTVCPRDVVMQVLQDVTASASELRDNIGSMSPNLPRDFAVILPETFADAGWMTFENEVGMLVAAVERHCRPGCAIVVKPHPNSRRNQAEALRGLLDGKHEVIEVEGEFKRYPIELWWPFLSGRTIIAAGHSVLTLRFIYGVDVAQPLDETYVARHVPPHLHPFFRHVLSSTMEPMRNLDGWDGQSLLYAGRVETA